MSVPIYHVNAFTDRPFGGNPAAVCLLERMPDDDWLRAVGGQMNLSETAFVCPEGEGYRLRWFTPRVEVELCGHATLASAHALWEGGRLASDQPARFRTRGGPLTCVRRGDGIEMDFPAKPAEPCPAPAELPDALGTAVKESGRNGMDWVVEVESEAELRGLRPDFTRLGALPVRGVIVTARSASPGFDFVSRFFAPAVGVDEDPVTGSAHCCLGPYWSVRLGKDELRAYQASARGGELRVRTARDRVFLGGTAVTVLRGVFLL